MVAAQPDRQFRARHAGHHMVGDDNVGAIARIDHAERQFGMIDIDDLIAHVGQHVAGAGADQRIVVDQQQLAALPPFGRVLCIRAAGARRVLRDRQPQHDRGAAADLAVDLDRAAQLSGQAMGHGQAQPMAGRLGGEKGLHRRFAHFGRHAEPGVADGDADIVARRQARGRGRAIGADAQRAAIGHGVPAVDRDVEDRKLQLVGVGADGGQIGGQIDRQGDARAHGARQQRLHARDQVGQVHRRGRERLAPREGQQPLHQYLRRLGRLQRHAGVAVDRFGRALGRQDQVQPGDDRGQQIVEVMRDMAGQLAHRLHLLELADHVLRLFQFLRAIAHPLVQLIVQRFERGEEPAIFQRGRRRAGQRLQQRHFIVAGLALFGPIGADRRRRLHPADRHHHHAAHEGAFIGVDGHAGIVEDVGNDHGLAVAHGPTRHAVAGRETLAGPERRHRILGDIMAQIAFAQDDRDAVRPHGAAREGAQHIDDGVDRSRAGERLHRFGRDRPSRGQRLLFRTALAHEFPGHRRPSTSESETLISLKRLGREMPSVRRIGRQDIKARLTTQAATIRSIRGRHPPFRAGCA